MLVFLYIHYYLYSTHCRVIVCHVPGIGQGSGDTHLVRDDLAFETELEVCGGRVLVMQAGLWEGVAGVFCEP